MRKPGLSILSSEITARTRLGIVHSGGHCLPLLPTHSAYSSQIRSNNRSNSGGALSASDLVEERLEELLLDGNENGSLCINRRSADVGLPKSIKELLLFIERAFCSIALLPPKKERDFCFLPIQEDGNFELGLPTKKDIGESSPTYLRNIKDSSKITSFELHVCCI